MSARSGPSATVTDDGKPTAGPPPVLVLYLEREPASAPLSERVQADHIRNERQRAEEMRKDVQKWEENWKEAGTK